ncbi:hypothetical protein IWW48_001162 [Coemansia sp. RSA 1200]|nr:hypothetical protein IWW48_001162 [Coemansia sp. RSA 1200]
MDISAIGVVNGGDGCRRRDARGLGGCCIPCFSDTSVGVAAPLVVGGSAQDAAGSHAADGACADELGSAGSVVAFVDAVAATAYCGSGENTKLVSAAAAGRKTGSIVLAESALNTRQELGMSSGNAAQCPLQKQPQSHGAEAMRVEPAKTTLLLLLPPVQDSYGVVSLKAVRVSSGMAILEVSVQTT